MEAQTIALVLRSFLTEQPIVLGISSEGNFLVRVTNGRFEVLSDRNFLFLIRLLELEYLSFCKTLTDMSEEFSQHVGDDVNVTVKDFPFAGVLKMALTSNRDHWTALAFPWMLHVGKEHFYLELTRIVQCKLLSQRLRHQARKLLPLPDFRNQGGKGE